MAAASRLALVSPTSRVLSGVFPSAQVRPTSGELDVILERALRSPSVDNSQPWTVRRGGGIVRLGLDEARARNDQIGAAGALLSLGALAESICLAAEEASWSATLFGPGTADATEAASGRGVRIELAQSAAPPDADVAELAAALPQRATNRSPFAPVPLLFGDVLALEREHSAAAQVHIQTRRAVIDTIAQASARAERIRFATTPLRDAMKWLRFSARAVDETNDGIDVRNLGLSRSEQLALRATRSPLVHRVFRLVGARMAGRRVKRLMRAVGGIGAIAVKDLAPATLFEAGRVMLRVWLRATALGIAFAPMTVGALLPLGRRFGARFEDPRDEQELDVVEQTLRSSFRFADDAHTVFVFRLGLAAQSKLPTARRPLSAFVGAP